MLTDYRSVHNAILSYALVEAILTAKGHPWMRGKKGQLNLVAATTPRFVQAQQEAIAKARDVDMAVITTSLKTPNFHAAEKEFLLEEAKTLKSGAQAILKTSSGLTVRGSKLDRNDAIFVERYLRSSRESLRRARLFTRLMVAFRIVFIASFGNVSWRRFRRCWL